MMFTQLRYPAGPPGAALALLRLSLAGTLGFVSLGSEGASAAMSIASAVLACLLVAGFLTRFAALVFALAGSVAVLLGKAPITYVPLMAEGVALALLGPGAWSVDASGARGGSAVLRELSRHDR